MIRFEKIQEKIFFHVDNGLESSVDKWVDSKDIPPPQKKHLGDRINTIW